MNVVADRLCLRGCTNAAWTVVDPAVRTCHCTHRRKHADDRWRDTGGVRVGTDCRIWGGEWWGAVRWCSAVCLNIHAKTSVLSGSLIADVFSPKQLSATGINDRVPIGGAIRKRYLRPGRNQHGRREWEVDQFARDVS